MYWAKKLRKLLESYEIRTPRVDFVSNVTAGPVKDAEELKELLGRQVCSPVRWQKSMEYMIQNGVDTFIEIGPGHTLGNFAKKIDRSLQIYNVETVEDLENLKQGIKISFYEENEQWKQKRILPRTWEPFSYRCDAGIRLSF